MDIILLCVNAYNAEETNKGGVSILIITNKERVSTSTLISDEKVFMP